MRIKRFVAPDMRAALKMVRDEHGPDAVILSNRPVHGGIEVVAATDYDEALVQQALRTAADAETLVSVPRAPMAAPAPTEQVHTRLLDDVLSPPTLSRADAMIAALGGSTLQARSQRTALAERARGVATIETKPAIASLLRKPVAAPALQAQAASNPSDDFRELLARLNASEEPASLFAPKAALGAAPVDESTAPVPATFEIGVASHTQTFAPVPEPSQGTSTASAPGYSDTFETPFDADARLPMEAAPVETALTFNATVETLPATLASTGAPVEAVSHTTPELALVGNLATGFDAATAPPAGSTATTNAIAPDFADLIDATHNPVPTLSTTAIDAFDALAEMAAVQAPAPAIALAIAAITPPALQIVGAHEDPGIVAMRNELASMRQMIERQMGQFGLERLRGSPARALAFETLQAYGCDDALAQAIASRIDPRLEPARVKAPLLAELARMLTIARCEPLEDGGVFALIGPTGAGKTTTIAKLAARFAQRHRARDVALVTTDVERPGAREQLHALGRKLGITVCEAQGPEGLSDALDQLVDYPLVLVDTAGYAARDRALLGQVTWLRATRRLRSLLVLPANLQPQDLSEAVRRYRMAAPEAVVLTKLDETGRLGSALSVAIKHGLTLAYTSAGQQVPADLEAADASRLVLQLERLRRAADNPLATEERHVVA